MQLSQNHPVNAFSITLALSEIGFGWSEPGQRQEGVYPRGSCLPGFHSAILDPVGWGPGERGVQWQGPGLGPGECVEEGQRPPVKGLCDGTGATPQLPKRSGVHARLVGGLPSQQSSSMASLRDEESGSKPAQTHISLFSIDLPFK